MSKREIEIRIPEKVGKVLKNEVYREGKHEYVVFALASHAVTSDKILILVNEVFTLKENQYVETYRYGAMWRGSNTIDIINKAIEKKLGILVFHSHQHKGKVSLSTDDLKTASSLLPSYQNLIRERPHAFVVLGLEHGTGVALLPEDSRILKVSRVRWIDKVISNWDRNMLSSFDMEVSPIYASQALLIGGKGQKIIENAKIAVVGLSGGGSHVVQQLAHLGIGEVIGIDDDVAEEGNRHRMIGLSDKDVLLKTPKTKVMKNLVKHINENMRFTEVPFKVTDQQAINQVKRADIVVGCVDSFNSRSDIHELCIRYLIPYIDIGLLIRPMGSDSFSIGGNVFTIIPGCICMWCIGFLSNARLSEENQGKSRNYFLGKKKQAQVVSFNGLLASAAVNELLYILTGYGLREEQYTIKKFDGIKNTLEEWVINSDPNCQFCNSIASGDPIWVTVNN